MTAPKKLARVTRRGRIPVPLTLAENRHMRRRREAITRQRLKRAAKKERRKDA